jgi:molecular chaperone GrpE
MREAAEAVEARQTKPAPARKAAPEGEAKARIEELEQELETLQDRHLRLQAEFQNFRRRALKEREEAHHYGHQNLVKELLPTVDNLERAIEHARQSAAGDLEGLLQGVELVQRELMGTLGRHGLREIPAEGRAFDPELHEAMTQLEDESATPGTVVKVFQRGYTLRDRMIRPTRVAVARLPGSDSEESKPDEDSGKSS